MDPAELQASVAETIKELYVISRELEQLFPGRHCTPDGHMDGSIGEALAAWRCGAGLALSIHAPARGQLQICTKK